MDIEKLKNEPRLLIEVSLKPVQGTRFQPTGFPDLGAATYQTHDGTQLLLVESAQSMANRLEVVCWDEAKQEPHSALKGIPYVVSVLIDGTKTNSLLEAHRLNSPYIVNSNEFQVIKKEIGFEKDKPFDKTKLVKSLFKYDPNSLIHGIFLEKVGGVVRLPRLLSGFIEAVNVTIAPSGGTKFDRIQPETSGDNTPYGNAAEGYGNVPFHRDEYTGPITAYFNLDLALLHGYGLKPEEEKFLITFALFKIRKFLREGLRLRTACDLTITNEQFKIQPSGFNLSSLEDLEGELKRIIPTIKSFANPSVTQMKYEVKAKKGKKDKSIGEEIQAND